ncbi:flagellar biosynthetic protein FliR [Polynucleobacter sp. MWH-Mekk-B1]|uniref:Flagellar biosynthetic protein FliR n=1 Tax=Polynucleobacter aenigmaticus TaxID=1743164 RepID=A0A254PZ71_9BURK|nr:MULTISPECIES: flagellar biosynthetic protein FliR [Polynucleobacter]MBU3545097.1 flagellar biosynthetic protein FliR [Polynucleobacter finlandensis]OWS71853.1 flagellar biosynthetic protein FliR [Polynucleobacter aenigmaticus]
MIDINTDLLQAWVTGLLIPLTRILAFISIAPFFGNKSISLPMKVAMGFMLAVAIAPAIPGMPTVDLLSLQGVLTITQQMIIGLAMGLMVQIIFTAIEMAGQISGLTMGFGFATFFDHQSQGSTAVISQFLNVLAMLVFLSMDGHLMMISALLESFYSFPVSDIPGSIDGMRIALWGENIFSIGLQLALPVVATLLITNMALGVLTRSAPQLNIFGIGFPLTLCVGFIVIALMLPSMALPYSYFIEKGITASKSVLKLR